MANTRWRTICKITLKRKNMPYFCTLIVEENGRLYKRVIFVDKDDIERSKEKYGDRLEVLL